MNLDYKILDLAQITNGTIKGNNLTEINSIFIDSRNHFNKDRTLFIAINGNYNDGHNYIAELYQKGLRNFIIEQSAKIKETDFQDANFIRVENSIKALQQIAAHHRKKFDIPVIGITGSNGKTTIKEWLYHFLRNDYNIIRSPKSYNSQVGVPLSVLQMKKEHTLAIFEAGISLPGEMDFLESIISPTYGILTNVNTSHIENFTTQKEIENEKIKLFKNCEYVFVKGYINALDTISIQKEKLHSTINANWKGQNIQFTIPFINKAAIENSITCVSFLLNFGLDANKIISKTGSLPQIALRLETRKGKKGNVIILDNYNSDIVSLQIAMDYLDRYDKTKKRQLIISDIKQDLVKSNDLYKNIAALINERGIDTIIGIGKDILNNRALFNKGYFYENTEQYIEDIDFNTVENTVILLKGSREYNFEQISNLLEEKTHETVLEINLNAITNNIKTYKNLLQPNTRLLAMVKAFGYGAGIKELGQILQHNKIDYLGVAYTDEGITLRKEGNILPIIVMNAEKSSYTDVIENDLEPAFFSFNQLDDFIRKLIDLRRKDYPVHIKIDTGMSRLGFVEEDLDNLISLINSQPEVRVKSIFSHLAGSDSLEHDEFTLQQINLFKTCAAKLEEQLGYSCIKHILNTSGIERFPDYQLDMVRLGIGMYGESTYLNNLETVGKLKTVISQIKEIKKGTSVGYGRSDYAEKDMLIGILPIGYADGFSRILSNGIGHVFINGKLAPVLGKVCMDMTLVDLTNIQAAEGDEVEIFGPNRSIKALAKEMNTISYEVMTSVSERVVRVYLEE